MPGAPITREDIQGAVALRSESFMVPKFVTIVPDLPRTTTGKIAKSELS